MSECKYMIKMSKWAPMQKKEIAFVCQKNKWATAQKEIKVRLAKF